MIVTRTTAKDVLLDEDDIMHDKYYNFERVAQFHFHFEIIAALLVFFVTIKILNYMSFNRTMSQINRTLRNVSLQYTNYCILISILFKSGIEVACFGVMFLIVFVAFVELGNLLFKTKVSIYL